MTGPFGIGLQGAVEFGVGALAKLPSMIRSVGAQRAFLISDPGVRAAGILGSALDVLGDAGIAVAAFDRIEPNPTVATLAAAAEAARGFGPAAIVPVGGGSSLDAAKGVALLVDNGGDQVALRAGTASLAPPPLVAVPTTAGTGAETNGFGVIADPDGPAKIYLGDPTVTPRACLLDPELTLGLPPAVTAATGTDALVHGVESLTSRGRNPISAAYAHEAVRLIARWLPVAMADGSDLPARSNLLLGAHLAGRALTISGLGLVHGLGHAITAHLGTPHGVALASVFRQVLRFNQAAAAAQLAEVAADLGAGETADAAVGRLQEIIEEVGAYRRLSALGGTPELAAPLARTALADAVTRNNPRTPTAAEVTWLVQASL